MLQRILNQIVMVFSICSFLICIPVLKSLYYPHLRIHQPSSICSKHSWQVNLICFILMDTFDLLLSKAVVETVTRDSVKYFPDDVGLIFRNFLWRCSHLKYITDANFIPYSTFRFKYQLTYQLHRRLYVVRLTKCTQLLFT